MVDFRPFRADSVRGSLGNDTKYSIFDKFCQKLNFSKKVKFFIQKNFNTQSLTFWKSPKVNFNTQSPLLKIFCNFSWYSPTKFAKNFQVETVY